MYSTCASQFCLKFGIVRPNFANQNGIIYGGLFRYSVALAIKVDYTHLNILCTI